MSKDVFQVFRVDPTDAEGRSATARRLWRERVFWTFQAIFWGSIGIAMLGLPHHGDDGAGRG